MNAACERFPDNVQFRFSFGVAQYRLGKFQNEQYANALATLTRCDQGRPATLAFLALTRHQLGQKDQARAALTRLQGLMIEPAWAANAEARLFLQEAVELIEGKPAQPGP
jgi:hypothetical protein